MTDVNTAGQVGEQNAVGIGNRFAQGERAETLITELHGRFYQQNYRGRVFSGGMGLTAINNATFTTGTLGNTCTPIAGWFNPTTSLVNAVVLQATLGVTLTALAATGGGPYVWATSIGNTAISTGTVPLNRKTLAQAGASGKDMCGVALTGLTNNLVVRFGSALGGGSAESVAFTATAVAMQTQLFAFVENLDGSLIVPPGGVIALLATTTPVAHSVVSSILVEEVPL